MDRDVELITNPFGRESKRNCSRGWKFWMSRARSVPAFIVAKSAPWRNGTASANATKRLVGKPWIIVAGTEWRVSGTKRAAISEAPATPKLIDICWPVLAIVLAPLVWAGVTSA